MREIDDSISSPAKLRSGLSDDIVEESAVRTMKTGHLTPGQSAPNKPVASIVDAFTHQVHQQPDAVAVVMHGREISYRTIDERANQLAIFLLQQGVTPGSIVPLALERSAEFIIATLAVLKCGAAYMPMDSRYPLDYVRIMLEDAQPKVAVCAASTSAEVRAELHAASVVIIESDDPASKESAESLAPKFPSCSADTAAYIMYTSGSTGIPKGVIIPHRAVLRLVINADFASMTSDEIWLHHSSTAFDASTLEIWAPLLNGARCVVFNDDSLTPFMLRNLIEQERITNLWVGAALFNAMVDEEPAVFNGLQQVLLGGEVLSPTHVAHAMNASPEVQFINGYGPTENTTFTCTHLIVRGDLRNLSGIPIGAPIKNTTVFILDELSQPVPVGTVGELCTGGAGVALGYLARPELTAERFIQTDHLSSPASTIYRTGDLVCQRDDGIIEYHGRADRQVKLRGFRLELSDIEYHLAQISEVTQAVLDVKVGPDGNDHLVAYIRSTNATPLDDHALREILSEKLPAYAIPRLFIAVDTFPVTVNGKLDLNALPDPWRVSSASKNPEKSNAVINTVAADVVASEDERKLCAVCAAILGVSAVQPTDNLLELGGNSLHAMRLTAKIQQHWSIPLRVADVMRMGSLTDTVQLINNTLADLPGVAETSSISKSPILQRTGPDAPHFESIIEAFTQVVETFPNTIAVQLDDEKLTYRELDQRANSLAAVLADAGVVHHSIVPLAIARSIDHVIAILAVLKLGGTYLPVDFKYPADYIRQMLDDSKPVAAVCGSTVPSYVFKTIEAADITIIDLNQRSYLGNLQILAPTAPKYSSEDIAYIMFTSGSTGKPKGVLVPHRGILSLIVNCSFVEMSQHEVWLYRSPVVFDLSTVELWAPLLNGGRCVIWSEDVLTPSELRHVINHDGVNSAQFVPSLFNALVDVDPTAFQGLNQVILGGEPLSSRHVERAMTAHPALTIINGYGPTEDTVYTCTHVFGAKDLENPAGIPIGRPIENTAVVILDENLQPVPLGQAGELCTGGAGVAQGYLNRPKITASRFIQHELATAPSPFLYRTGDLVRQRPEDSVIEFLGRLDRQVKIRGFRIELGEIEFHLQQNEGILGAIVIAKDGPGGGIHLIAYVKTADGMLNCTQSEIQDSLRRKLPPQSIPTIVIALPEFPTTSRGKVDLKTLPDPWAKKTSLVETGKMEVKCQTACDQKMTAQERTVLNLCTDLLQLPGLTLKDSLFDLGGTSLHAMRLAARIDELHHVRVRIPALLKSSSLKEIAQLIQAAEVAQKSATNVELSDAEFDADSFPLSSEQRRLWFLCTLHPESPAFHLNAAYTLKGSIDPERLQKAFHQVIRRHDALRVSFTGTEGRCRQHIAHDPPFTLAQSDLSHLAESEHLEAAIELARQDSLKLFDLGEAPLIRVRLTRLADNRHILSLTKHHLITDAWSLRILLDEVSNFYNDNPPRGAAPQLIQHIRERAAILESPTAAENLKYWCKTLAGSVASEIPTDFTRKPTPSPSSARIVRTIPSALLDRLNKLAAASRGTIHTLILSAFLEVLSRHSGSRDLTIGVTLAERHTTQSQNLFGFLVQSLPFRADLSGNPSFSNLLKRITATWFEVLDRQDVAFDAIVQAVAPQRDMARNPLFQILFNHVDFTDCQLSISDLDCQYLPYTDTRVAFDLSLDVHRTENATSLALAFDESLYQHETITRIADRLLTLLEAVASQPDLPLSKIAMLPVTNGEPIAAIPSPAPASDNSPDSVASLPQAILAQAHSHDSPGIIYHKKNSCTHSDLHEGARAVAYALCTQPKDSQAATAVFLNEGVSVLRAFFGSLQAGSAFISLDPAASDEQLLHVLADTQPTSIITEEQLVDRAKTLATKLAIINIDQITAPPTDWQPPSVSADQAAYHLCMPSVAGQFRMSSTTQQNFHQHLNQYASIMNVKADDRVSVLFGHVSTSALLDIFTGLLNAASLVLLDPRQDSPELINQALADHQVTILHTTPTLFRRLCFSAGNTSPFASVRSLILSGEPVTQIEIALYRQHLPASATLTNLYALADSPTALSHTVNKESTPTNTDLPLGIPFADSIIELLDADGNLAEVFGQLTIVNGFVASDFNENLSPTNKAIRQLSDRRTRICTGDWARRKLDGSFAFAGRQDCQITIRGVRLNLVEIENAITSIPYVSECRVLIDRGDERHSDSLIAYYLPLTEDKTLDSLHADLRGILPHYMIPERWVEVDNLMLGPSAKIDEAALRTLPVNAAPAAIIVEPRDEIERLIMKAWHELLPDIESGIHRNFFQIGGYSLLAVQLMARIKKQTGQSIPLSVLFEKPTIAHLAEFCRSGARIGKSRTIVTLRAEGTGTPVFFLPGSGGSPYGMMPIVQNTKYHGPCHAITYPGFLDNDGSFTDMQDLAAQLLKAVREVQPVGPYRFVGFSFGGGVAFEMAHQLQADDQEVGSLVFLDAFAPRAIKNKKPLRRLLVHLRHLLSGETEYLLHLLERIRARVTGQVDQASKPDVHHSVEDLADQSSLATDNYYPKAIKGDLVLMTAGTRPVWWDFVEVAPRNGWDNLFEGSIIEHQIDLDHLEMVNQAGARKAGEILTDLLAKLDR